MESSLGYRTRSMVIRENSDEEASFICQRKAQRARCSGHRSTVAMAYAATAARTSANLAKSRSKHVNNHDATGIRPMAVLRNG